MSADSPAVILFDTNGNEVTLADGYSITVDTRGIPIIIVSDSDEAKLMRADADGYLLSSSRINEELPAGTNIIGKIGVDSANTGGLALESTLSSLEGKDFATETTQQTLATEATLQDAYSTIISIKDIDGVKKISDPVAVTDNGGSLTVDGPLTDTELRASAVETKEIKSSTSSVSNVAGSTSTVTILSSNADRLGASVQNDTNKDMYLKLGSGASTSSYTVLLERDFYYEVPFGYTGILTAVWDTGVSGSARVTEFTE